MKPQPYVRKKVKITFHARERLKERCKEFNSIDYINIATSARYRGSKVEELSKKERAWLKHHFNLRYRSSQIRIYKDVIFIFAGNHSRTLITVYKMPEFLKESVENSKPIQD